MTDGANPPPAHNWHLERTNTAVKRSAHALVTATALRNHWSVHRDSYNKTPPKLQEYHLHAPTAFAIFVFSYLREIRELPFFR